VLLRRVSPIGLTTEWAVAMMRDGVVVAHTGEEIPLRVDTICVHGDKPAVVEIAEAIRRGLETARIEVVPMKNSLHRFAT